MRKVTQGVAAGGEQASGNFAAGEAGEGEVAGEGEGALSGCGADARCLLAVEQEVREGGAGEGDWENK